MNRTIAALAATLTAFTLSACSEPAGRTGTGPGPVTLKAPTSASDGLFGRLAKATATAAVKVTLVPTAPTDRPEDAVTLDRLRTGAFDLATVRAGRLEAEGARSLAPLGTPFLVTNEDQAEAIAGDPRAEDLYTGLAGIGLVGISLVPMGVRHPFGYGTPLLGASDYAGKEINTRVDATAERILSTLGANIDHSGSAERTGKVKAGSLRGIEASAQTVGAVDLPAVLTSNVDLYARFDVVVVRKATWDALTTSQRAALRAAVTKANSAVSAASRSETDLITEWCHLPGASSTMATDAQLETLHAKLDPLVAEIKAAHAATLDWMSALRAGTTDPEPGCGGWNSNPPWWATLEPVGDQSALDGVWRIANSQEQLEAGGLTPSDAYNNTGVWELDIRGGKAVVTLPNHSVCHWTFTFAGRRVLVDLGPDASCMGQMLGTYTRAGDRVTFTWQRGGDGVSEDDAHLGTLYSALFGRMVKVQSG